MAEPRRYRSLVVRELALLELRRTAHGTLALLALLMIAVATGIHWEAPAADLRDAAELAAQRGLERVTGWAATLALLVPALVLHAAGIARRWRKGEADWLGCAPRSRTAVLLSTWIGTTCGAAALLLAAAVVVELRGTGASDTTRTFARHALGNFVRIEPHAAATGRFTFPRWPAGSRLRARVQPSPGGAPTTDARALVRVGGTESTRKQRVATPTWIEVELPPPFDPAQAESSADQVEIEIEIANLGTGAMTLVTPGTFELSSPAGSERLGSLSILARVLCALASLTALALGLGTWVGSGSAALLALLAWFAPALWLGGPTWWPGGDLVRVLDIVGEGRLPEILDARSVACTAIVCTLGLVCGVPGLRSWRFPR